MIIRKVNEKGIRITKISGADLPLETEKNVAGVAGLALLDATKSDFGFEIEIHKKIKQRIASRILSLPLYHSLTTDELEVIIDLINTSRASLRAAASLAVSIFSLISCLACAKVS